MGLDPVGQELIRDSNMVLIVDEYQNSYGYEPFWNDLVERQASDAASGPYIALFASFGSPGGTPVRNLGSFAPVQLSNAQRASLRPTMHAKFGLIFDESQFLEVVHHATTKEQYGQPFLPAAETKKMIWDLTSGHPGATRTLLDLLIHAEVCQLFLASFHRNSL